MEDILRDVALDLGLHGDGEIHRLTIWDTYRTDTLGKSILGYRLLDRVGNVIFEGEDFCCSPLHAIDSDDALAGLLTFLSLQPGDTDDEYFEDYTDEQLEYVAGYGECLSLLYASDNAEEREAFADWS